MATHDTLLDSSYASPQNFFRIAGDVCHLLSFVVMFWKLNSSQSVAGISLKTQELYVIVFVARYLDLFWNFLSIYNWVRAAGPKREHCCHSPFPHCASTAVGYGGTLTRVCAPRAFRSPGATHR